MVYLVDSLVGKSYAIVRSKGEWYLLRESSDSIQSMNERDIWISKKNVEVQKERVWMIESEASKQAIFQRC